MNNKNLTWGQWRTRPWISLVACTLVLMVSSAADAAIQAQALISNAVKYRDSTKVATGRSGSATLTARALMDSSQNVELELTTGALDSRVAPPGNIGKVQLKVLDALGEVQSTQNYSGLADGGYLRFPMTGLRLRQQVQVQTNITGIDTNRTNVVTVVETVKLRPDLILLAAKAPPSVIVGTPVSISVAVKEALGESGARADIVLYDGSGQELDRARNIWVDAGGLVSTVFTTTFQTPGARNLSIRIEGASPAEFSTDNDSTSVALTVTEGLPLSYVAVVNDIVFSDHQESDGYLSLTSGGVDSNYAFARTIDLAGWVQDVLLEVSSNTTYVTFPVTFTYAEWADGTLIATATSSLPADFSFDFVSSGSLKISGGCSVLFNGPLGAMFSMCTQRVVEISSGAAVSQFIYGNFFRFAGDVTFHSVGFDHFWSRYDGTDNFYSINDNGRSLTGTRVPLTVGTQYIIELSMGSADGRTLRAAPVVPLSAYSDFVDRPYTCVELAGDGFALRDCNERQYNVTGVQGFVIGP